MLVIPLFFYNFYICCCQYFTLSYDIEIITSRN
uniref:Uncharacterized protein n=1 Tax=Arundo donax TaxID=35708 RepID=A0A0A9HV56_ARUDO